MSSHPRQMRRRPDVEALQRRVASLEQRVCLLDHAKRKAAREFIVKRIVTHCKQRAGFLVAVIPGTVRLTEAKVGR